MAPGNRVDLTIMQKRLSKIEKEDIVEKYLTGKYTLIQLGRDYLVSGEAIGYLLKKLKIKVTNSTSRKYSINHNYFDTIDGEHKAYWLGLLYSDGSNSQDVGLIRIGLQIADKEILEKFNIDIGSNKPLRIKELNKECPTLSDICLMSFSSRQLSDRLAQLGVHQNKVYTVKFPTEEQIPKYLLRHWLRGMWDGDGCSSLSYSKNRKTIRLSSCLVGTKDICLLVQKYLKNEININSSVRKTNNSEAYSLMLTGCRNVYLFYDWLYSDCELYMNRKFLKVKEHERIILDRIKVSKNLFNSFRGILC